MSALVIDQDPSRQTMLSDWLTERGIQPLQASHHQQAVAIIRQHDIDMVFIAIDMDNLKGIDTLDTLRRADQDEQRRTPIIAMSTHKGNGNKRLALTKGCDDYLTLPLDPTQPVAAEPLASICRRWLALQGKTTQAPPSSTPLEQPTQAPRQANSDLCDAVNPSAHQPAQKVVDIQQSLIYSHHNPELARDMLSALMVSLEQEKQPLRLAFEQQDWQTLEDKIHKLNGSCCYCGVTQLREAVHHTHQALQMGDIEAAKTHFPQVMAAIDTLLAWHQVHDIAVLFE